jgi:hypothetical protein
MNTTRKLDFGLPRHKIRPTLDEARSQKRAIVPGMLIGCRRLASNCLLDYATRFPVMTATERERSIDARSTTPATARWRRCRH